jgi:hypothetical protein
MPRTAAEVVSWVDRRGAADLQRILGCTRRQLDLAIMQARRFVTQGDGYTVVDLPHGTVTRAKAVRGMVPKGVPGEARHLGSPSPSPVLSEAEYLAVVAPPELATTSIDDRIELERCKSEAARLERNRAAGIYGSPDLDPWRVQVNEPLAAWWRATFPGRPLFGLEWLAELERRVREREDLARELVRQAREETT